MGTVEGGGRRRSKASEVARYVVKAAVLYGALFLLVRYAPQLPAWGVAVCWAALSALMALSFAYRYVVKKTLKQYAYQDGGRLARFNGGRVVCLVAAFAVSAVCVAGLLFEAAAWDLRLWALAAAAIPLYPLAAAGAGALMRKEYRPAFRASQVAKWGGLAVAALLCALYAGICVLQPVAEADSLESAFASAFAGEPFAGSPSALMAEAGKLAALLDGLTSYGVAQAGEVSAVAAVAIRLAMVVSTFVALVSLLSLCFLPLSELKRVFLPLEAGMGPEAGGDVPAGEGAADAGNDAPAPPCGPEAASARAVSSGEPRDARRRPVKGYLAVAGALPVLLAVVFCAVDSLAADAVATQGHTAVENFVRDQVDLAVYVIDGAYYDQRAVEGLVEETAARSAALADEAQTVLVPLVNASFDARIANVDGYLDWYYSLPADYERLATMIVGSAQDYMEGQLAAKLEEGVDDSELMARLAGFSEQASELQSEFAEKLSDYRIEGVPDWLPAETYALDMGSLTRQLEPSQRLVDAEVRLGAGAAAGATTGVVAKQVVKKVVEKEFFKKAVAKIANMLASRGISGVVGGAVGTVGGPLGTIAGAAVGTAVGVGIDYGMLKVDEWQNREANRQEIVDVIEEERAATLALVEGDGEDGDAGAGASASDGEPAA